MVSFLIFPFQNPFKTLLLNYTHKVTLGNYRKGETMKDSTKSNIAQALIYLLQKKSLKEITVQDIVDKAGYSRKTFYYYFANISDLVEWALQQQVEVFLSSKSDNVDFITGMKEILNFMSQNKTLIINMNAARNKDLAKYVQRTLGTYLGEALNRAYSGKRIDYATVRSIVKLCIYGLYGFLEEWILEGLPDEELSSINETISACRDLVAAHVDSLPENSY